MTHPHDEDETLRFWGGLIVAGAFAIAAVVILLLVILTA